MNEEVLTRSLQKRFPGLCVTEILTSPIGTGQMADSLRVQMQHTGNHSAPATLIAKVPKANEASRAASRMSRVPSIQRDSNRVFGHQQQSGFLNRNLFQLRSNDSCETQPY